MKLLKIVPTLGLMLALAAASIPPTSAAGLQRGREPAQGDVAAGRDHAQRVCIMCHDVTSPRSGLTTNLVPPAFSEIANAKTTTPMGLNVFLVTPHANMPNLILSDVERRNLIAFILSFREERQPRT